MALLSTARSFGVDYFPFGFLVSGKMWDWHRMSELLTPPEGEPRHSAASSLAYAMRALADRLNLQRESAHTYAVPVVHAGQLLGMGALTDVLRYLSDYYCVKSYPGSLIEGLDVSGARLGAHTAEQPLREFVKLYTPHAVRQGTVAEAVFLDAAKTEKDTRYVVGRETLLLHLTMVNPALAPFLDLYDDEELKRRSAYELLIEGLGKFFAARSPFPGSDKDLLNFLLEPMRACPDSIEGQLEYILAHWASLLPPELLELLQFTRGVLKEETRMRGLGPGPTMALAFGEFDWGYAEPARFTMDKDWMSNVVLIAKSTYVWLDQLSKKYQRPIVHLNDIPDEELDRLANWGFTGLWLIGVWERSSASQTIKQWMGNPEALPSAYSLFDYVIAEDLGGEPAYNDLRDRAWARGIRLASDMVPNHVGLYSRWVIEHPDWFVQLPYPPFPSYTFNGGDLSGDGRVGLFIEDGYWNHSDAAVVFKRVDRWTGDTRYIYHGNDGTSMPWNDTAQLNFLIAEAREAVIQTILHVVRKFPIIRFDAAMTLSKRHYQRLWFPKPGDGGAIPSRAEHGMSKPEFDRVFPEEFWREVVDRVQAEAPDTLLVAEAFWLMEGYFVRTLGMHRVYNSAFMNMLKMEENSKYRVTIRNVLEFSPEVLKRLVNFMNNPDERTAIEQFGKEDKYYGVAVLMVTMPGMPMFGHGQIEGFAEKYGMEYRRAYWDEQVDEHMIWRHEQEVFPLMRRRHLFSGVEHFFLYDCVTPGGWVDENVFAFSNRAGDDRAIIIYNNAYATTSGTINWSVSYNVGDAENKDLRRATLAQALGLDTGDNCYYAFRDHRTKLEYIRQGAALAREGFTVTLNAYQYNAFLDFHEIHDMDGTWGRLAYSLEGKGVPSLDEAYAELILQPVHAPLRKVMTGKMLRQLAEPLAPEVRAEFEEGMLAFFQAVTLNTPLKFDEAELLEETLRELDALHSFRETIERIEPDPAIVDYILSEIPEEQTETLVFWRIPLAFALTHQVARAHAAIDFGPRQGRRADELLLGKIVADAVKNLGVDEKEASLEAQLVKLLTTHAAMLDFAPAAGGTVAIRRMLEDPAARKFLFMNRHAAITWINKEQFDKLVYWLLFESVLALTLDDSAPVIETALAARFANAREILSAAREAGYSVTELLKILGREEHAR